eukprot:m.176837 g.176837  ORF g.176837 m.176837 type:complete len:106 (+) comp39148_c0_seq20:420-737(+)
MGEDEPIENKYSLKMDCAPRYSVREGMAGIVPIDNFRREAALLFKSIRLEDIDWIGSLQSGTFGGYSFVQTSSLILSLRFQIRTLVWNSSDSYMQSHSATVLCRE